MATVVSCVLGVESGLGGGYIVLLGQGRRREVGGFEREKGFCMEGCLGVLGRGIYLVSVSRKSIQHSSYINIHI
jgi:hypothetical protein